MRKRFLQRAEVAVLVLLATVISPHPTYAGGATGAATEWTQLANNAELINLLQKSGVQIENQVKQIGQLAEQIQNQLRIYDNMLQNTARLPQHAWGKIEADLQRLQQVVDHGRGISFSMGNADDVLRQRFASYADFKTALPDGKTFSSQYQTWSDTNRDTITGTLKAANLTAAQFSSEEATMRSLRSLSETSEGQMKALQVGHQIAAEQVGQIQKLRGLVSQQMALTATWYQTSQTDKDLAHARRERFFDGRAPLGPGGQKLEPRW
ncbi:P-type conjugative transfer protein TrbJ [Ensifer sp.]|uniref:P-type conjugative transfer protein TrbJ n=1 Tax=Ensifer sp. TaxID=1872086 RepID=UPI00289A1C78|nr:P-type conjugative transfer protein TrbJ [Ensifer sp.]